jgi:SAM-dependent methyltransferase
LTRQAEKEYLRRSGAAPWERVKPFAPRGEIALSEGLHLIQEFGACVGLLDASPGHRILDLGAGGCWVSDGLQRLGLSAFAVDISHDLLAIGRERLSQTGPARVVTGDAEALPFPSGAFDRVMCLNAIHHVPDIPAALGELARVLNPDGLAVFSEPGVGHSKDAHARRAVQDFGVQEVDVEPTVFLDQCQAAGFSHVVLEPFARILPGYGLTPELWRVWCGLAAASRPRRALSTLRKGIFELFGIRKETDLFTEAFSSEVLRVLHAAMQHHPIVVASKRPFDRFLSREQARQASLRATIAVVDAASIVAPGEAMSLRIEVRNVGASRWTTTSHTARPVRVGVQLLDGERRLIDRNYARHSLPNDVAPGQACVVAVTFPAPEAPGQYAVKIDLVAEGVVWFETLGTTPAIHTIVVER